MAASLQTRLGARLYGIGVNVVVVEVVVLVVVEVVVVLVVVDVVVVGELQVVLPTQVSPGAQH
jgi:hypothetical protein